MKPRVRGIIILFCIIAVSIGVGVGIGVDLQEQITNQEQPTTICTCYLGDNDTVIQECNIPSSELNTRLGAPTQGS